MNYNFNHVFRNIQLTISYFIIIEIRFIVFHRLNKIKRNVLNSNVLLTRQQYCIIMQKTLFNITRNFIWSARYN